MGKIGPYAESNKCDKICEDESRLQHTEILTKAAELSPTISPGFSPVDPNTLKSRVLISQDHTQSIANSVLRFGNLGKAADNSTHELVTNALIEEINSKECRLPLAQQVAELGWHISVLRDEQGRIQEILPHFTALGQMQLRAIEQLVYEGTQIRDTIFTREGVANDWKTFNDKLINKVNQGINEMREALLSKRVNTVEEAFEKFEEYTTLKRYENFEAAENVPFYLLPYKWVLESNKKGKEDLPKLNGKDFKKLLESNDVNVEGLIRFSHIENEVQRERWLLDYTKGLRKNFASLRGYPSETVLVNLKVLEGSKDFSIRQEAETLLREAIGEDFIMSDAMYASLLREGTKGAIPMVLAMMVAGPLGACAEASVSGTEVFSAGRLVWSGANVAGRSGFLARGVGFAAEATTFWAAHDSFHATLIGGEDYWTSAGLVRSFMMLGGLGIFMKGWQQAAGIYFVKSAAQLPMLSLPLKVANKIGEFGVELGGFWGIGQLETLIGLAPHQEKTLRQELAEAGMTLIQLKLAVAAGNAVTGHLSQIKTIQIKLDTAQDLFKKAYEKGMLAKEELKDAVQEILFLQSTLTQLNGLLPAYAGSGVGSIGPELKGGRPIDRTIFLSENNAKGRKSAEVAAHREKAGSSFKGAIQIIEAAIKTQAGSNKIIIDLEKASAIVHDQWLERNRSWAPMEQNKSYELLVEAEKQKDRLVIENAVDFVNQQFEKENDPIKIVLESQKYPSPVETFWQRVEQLNVRLKAFDTFGGLMRKGKTLTDDQQKVLNDPQLKALNQERSELIRNNSKYHNLVSADAPGSEIREHLEAHLSTVDLGSHLKLGEKEVFKDGSSVIQFAEEWLQKAYKGEHFSSGDEHSFQVQTADSQTIEVKVRFMKSGEMANGVDVGPTALGGRIILQAIFDQPIGHEGITELKLGQHSLTVERISGGRNETVQVVDGKNPETNTLYIIGGPYGPTGQFGLYTIFPGCYSPSMTDTVYWNTHAFLTGESQPSFRHTEDGKVEIRTGSNLEKMASPDAQGRVKVNIPNNVACFETSE